MTSRLGERALALLAWTAAGVTVIAYGWFVWTALVAGAWLWAAGCLVLPLPVIPIYAWQHWPETQAWFLLFAGGFAVAVTAMMLLMRFHSR